MTLVREDVDVLDERLDAADAGAPQNAGARGFSVGTVDRESGVVHGLLRDGDRELREAIGAARVLPLEELQRIESLHLAGDLRLERARVEGRDRPDARASGEKGLPGRRRVVADGRDHADAGDDDPPTLSVPHDVEV